MNARRRLFFYLSAGLICLPGLAKAQADSLKHDPFARPVVTPRPTSAAPVPEPGGKPELRAIMAAGSKSIVNIDGVILRRGEQFNGYRLVEVHENSAVFVNNKKRVTLWLPGIEPSRIPPVRQDSHRVTQQGDNSRKPEDK